VASAGCWLLASCELRTPVSGCPRAVSQVQIRLEVPRRGRAAALALVVHAVAGAWTLAERLEPQIRAQPRVLATSNFTPDGLTLDPRENFRCPGAQSTVSMPRRRWDRPPVKNHSAYPPFFLQNKLLVGARVSRSCKT
jgi:hypothetical protein